MKHIGFTGTRHGMSGVQMLGVWSVVHELCRDLPLIGTGPDGDILAGRAHHGDCIGGDKQFHGLARKCGLAIEGHPSTHNLRAYCQFDFENERLPPMTRNAVIVDRSGWMVAAPLEFEEQPRGGTWGTVRIARRMERPLAIVWRDGTVSYERWP